MQFWKPASHPTYRQHTPNFWPFVSLCSSIAYQDFLQHGQLNNFPLLSYHYNATKHLLQSGLKKKCNKKVSGVLFSVALLIVWIFFILFKKSLINWRQDCYFFPNGKKKISLFPPIFCEMENYGHTLCLHLHTVTCTTSACVLFLGIFSATFYPFPMDYDDEIIQFLLRKGYLALEQAAQGSN